MARRKNVLTSAVMLMVLFTALSPLVAALPTIDKQGGTLVWNQGSDSEPSYDSRAGSEMDVYLYFHKATTTQQTYVLNTQGGSSGVDVMANAGSVTYRLQDPLTKNLKVFGHEITASQKGFWLDLGVSSLPSASITVEILDGDTAIANVTQQVQGTFGRWTVPFIGGVDSYTFAKGSKIAVRVTTSGNTVLELRSGDKLWVLCDPVSLSGDTYNSNGIKTKTFYPNTIQEDREVIIKGKIEDAWGASDVSTVTVTIKSPTGSVLQEGTAEVTGLNYTYNWNYSTGLAAGTYQAIVDMTDQQAHSFNITLDFAMASYGVLLDSPQAQESGIVVGAAEKGGCVDYTISVMNTGALPSSYTLTQSSSDVSGWTLSITPSETGTVAPGESKIVTVKVCADESVSEGTQSVFYVTAQAQNDPSAKATIQIITTASPKINLTLKWSTVSGACNNLVNTGGSMACGFELMNSGLQSLNVTLKMTMDKGSPDWTARIVPTSIVGTVLLLHPSQIVTGTLNISAPKDPSKQNKSIINIQAEVSDNTPPLTKSITATTIMSTGIGLECVGECKVKIDSDKTAEFFVLVSNSDPNNAHTITLSTTQPSSWGVEFIASSKLLTLNPQESQTVRIRVTPATGASAGTYSIEVTGKYQENPSTYDKTTLQVEIKENHIISLAVTPTEKQVGAEEGATFTVSITNSGNVDEKSVSILVSQTGGDLKVTVEIEGTKTLLKPVDIPKGQTLKVTVKITPKAEAKHKDTGTFSITAKTISNASSMKSVEVKVIKNTNQLLQETIWDWEVWILIVLMIVVVVFYGIVSRR